MWDELPQRFSGHAVLFYVNKKKQKTSGWRSALGLETPHSPPGRRCKANEVFCALFFKKVLLAC
jgi:hypothetical protein